MAKVTVKKSRRVDTAEMNRMLHQNVIHDCMNFSKKYGYSLRATVHMFIPVMYGTLRLK